MPKLNTRTLETRARVRREGIAWRQAGEDAFVAVNKLKDQGMFKDTDDARAEEALEFAIGVVRVREGVSTKDKLAAAKIILDFTKQKPVQRQQVAETAEAFLDNLIEE